MGLLDLNGIRVNEKGEPRLIKSKTRHEGDNELRFGTHEFEWWGDKTAGERWRRLPSATCMYAS